MRRKNQWNTRIDSGIALALGTTAFILNLSIAHYSQPIPQFGDSCEYFQLAKNIALGHGFTFDGITPAIYRPPLFSFMLGGWFRLLGLSSIANAAYFQALAIGLAVAVSFLLLQALLGSRRLAAVGSAILTLYPFISFNSVFILQEPLLLFVTTLAATITLYWIDKKTAGLAFLTGLAWGLCTLGKISTLFVPFLLVGLFAFHRIRPGVSEGFPYKQGVILMLGFCLTLLPWTYRNYRQFHHVILVNDQGLGTLEWFVGRGRLANAGGHALVTQLQANPIRESEERRLLFGFIRQHPMLTLSQNLKNTIWFCMIYRLWFETYTHWSMSGRYWIWPALLIHVPLYIGFFIGLRYAIKTKDLKILFLGSFYLVYWLQHILYWGEPRLAIPVFPILLALGFYGWMHRASKTVTF